MWRNVFFSFLVALAAAPAANAGFDLLQVDNSVSLVGYDNYGMPIDTRYFIAITGAGAIDTALLYNPPQSSIQNIVDPDLNNMLMSIVAQNPDTQIKEPLAQAQLVELYDPDTYMPQNGTLVTWTLLPNTSITVIDWNAVPVMAANVTPEPATIALLGLGGLLLKKRK